MKLSRKQLRLLIESFISGPRGTMAVPDTDPSLEIAGLSDEQREKMTQQVHPAAPLQYDALADAFGTVEDSDAEMYGHSPSDAYSIYKDPQGEYDKRSTQHTTAGIFKSLTDTYKAKAPDMIVDDRFDGDHTRRKATIYAKDKSVLEDLLRDLQKTPNKFNIVAHRGGGPLIDDQYVQLASDPDMRSRSYLQRYLGKYVMHVYYKTLL